MNKATHFIVSKNSPISSIESTAVDEFKRTETCSYNRNASRQILFNNYNAPMEWKSGGGIETFFIQT